MSSSDAPSKPRVANTSSAASSKSSRVWLRRRSRVHGSMTTILPSVPLLTFGYGSVSKHHVRFWGGDRRTGTGKELRRATRPPWHRSRGRRRRGARSSGSERGRQDDDDRDPRGVS